MFFVSHSVDVPAARYILSFAYQANPSSKEIWLLGQRLSFLLIVFNARQRALMHPKNVNMTITSCWLYLNFSRQEGKHMCCNRGSIEHSKSIRISVFGIGQEILRPTMKRKILDAEPALKIFSYWLLKIYPFLCNLAQGFSNIFILYLIRNPWLARVCFVKWYTWRALDGATGISRRKVKKKSV